MTVQRQIRLQRRAHIRTYGCRATHVAISPNLLHIVMAETRVKRPAVLIANVVCGYPKYVFGLEIDIHPGHDVLLVYRGDPT